MTLYRSKEMQTLLYDIDNYVSRASDILNDSLWSKILNDIAVYNDQERHSHFLEKTPECPLIQSDSPDVVYNTSDSDFVMGIECFEFDASKKTKDGSSQRKKEAEVHRNIDEEYRHMNRMDSESVSIKKKVDVKLSIENYYDSLLQTYINHAQKIGKYREKLKEQYPDKKIYLAFFISDVTAIGNYVSVDGKTESLSPLRLPIFVSLLRCTSMLDYVLVKTTDTYIPSVQIQSCEKGALEELASDYYGINDMYIPYSYTLDVHIP